MANKSLVNVEIESPVSLKGEVKIEIPKKSAGRLLDALTDAIRPFTESRGLRADQIRLQREDVLIEIAKRAEKRLAIEGGSPQPVPAKFLIPFMEKASLEGGTSELIDTWAKLLATASQNYDSGLIRYTSVLAELSPREVKFLDRVVNASRTGRPDHWIVDAPVGFMEWRVSESLDEFVERSTTTRGVLSNKRMDLAFKRLMNELEVPGGLLICVGIDGIEYSHPQFKGHDAQDELAIAVLKSLGLLRQEIYATRRAKYFCFSDCLHLTEFGLGFYLACNPELAKIVKQQDDEVAAEIALMAAQDT
jgi:hypothetical protein